MIDGIKSILIAVTEEGRGESCAALDYTLSLAGKAGAHLTLQAAASRFSIPYALIDQFSRDIISTENRRLAELAAKFAERAKGDAAMAGIVASVETPQLHYNDLRDRFVMHARVHDLVVLDAESEVIDIDRGLIEAAVFDSGRPLLLVPPRSTSHDGRRVVVAWDGSASAARAVAFSLPLLKAAEAVQIISIVGEKDLSRSVAGAELAPNLARHGVAVSVRTTTVAPGGDAAQTLRDEADEFGASLIVSGAYRHSKLTQWLLGGFTQSLLKRCHVPLLMAH